MLYCLYAFFNDVFILICNRFGFQHLKFHALSLFTIIEFCLFSLAIFYLISKFALKKIIIGIIPVFIAFSLIQYINSNPEDDIDSLSISVEYIIIIIFTLFYFYEEISIPQATFIYSTKAFWLITGILIYSAGTFFLFLFSDNLTDDEWEKWSIINYVFTILKNTCFGIAVTIKHTPDPLLSYESDSETNEIPENNLTINSNP